MLVAAAPIPPAAWELPYTTGAALKRKKKIDYNSSHFSDSPVEICLSKNRLAVERVHFLADLHFFQTLADIF